MTIAASHRKPLQTASASSARCSPAGCAAAFVLLLASCGHTSFMKALEQGDLTRAKQLAATTDLQASNIDGETALHFAARHGDVELVSALLDRGVSVHAKSGWNWNALQCAAAEGNLEVVRFLAERGADVNNAGAHGGLTPLHEAARGGHHDVIAFLVEKGAAVDPRIEHWQRTPLHLAKTPEAARVLLEGGADKDVQDKEGKTPAMLASELGRDDVASFIGTFRSTRLRNVAASNTAERPTVSVVSADELKAAAIQKIAVPQMEGSGVEPHFVQILSQAAVDRASRHGKLKVIGTADIEALLGFEKQKDLLSCDSVSCMAEIGGALGVDAILRMQLGKLGETFTVSATLIDIKRALPLVRGSARVRGKPDDLIPAVEDLVRRVLEPI